MRKSWNISNNWNHTFLVNLVALNGYFTCRHILLIFVYGILNGSIHTVKFCFGVDMIIFFNQLSLTQQNWDSTTHCIYYNVGHFIVSSHCIFLVSLLWKCCIIFVQNQRQTKINFILTLQRFNAFKHWSFIISFQRINYHSNEQFIHKMLSIMEMKRFVWNIFEISFYWDKISKKLLDLSSQPVFAYETSSVLTAVWIAFRLVIFS